MQWGLVLGENINERNGGDFVCQEDILAGRYICRKKTRAFYRARKTMCHKFFFERSRSPIFACLLKHIRDQPLLKRMRYRFYSLTLHNFIQGSLIVHTFVGIYAVDTVWTNYFFLNTTNFFDPEDIKIIRIIYFLQVCRYLRKKFVSSIYNITIMIYYPTNIAFSNTGIAFN